MRKLKINSSFYLDPAVKMLSDGAFRLHVTALAYCALHETDGVLGEDDLERLCHGVTADRHGVTGGNVWSLPGVLDLVNSNMWTRTQSGVTIDSFLLDNDTRSSVDRARELSKIRSKNLRSRHAVTADRHAVTVSPTPPSSELVISQIASDLRYEISDAGARAFKGLSPTQDNTIAHVPRPEYTDRLPTADYDTGRDVWCEEFQRSKNRPFPLTGARQESEVFRWLGSHARARGGDSGASWARHWVRSYLAMGGRVANEGHPLSWLKTCIARIPDPGVADTGYRGPELSAQDRASHAAHFAELARIKELRKNEEKGK